VEEGGKNGEKKGEALAGIQMKKLLWKMGERRSGGRNLEGVPKLAATRKLLLRRKPAQRDTYQ